MMSIPKIIGVMSCSFVLCGSTFGDNICQSSCFGTLKILGGPADSTICSVKELCTTLPHKMLICPTVRNPFRSYSRAFLLLLILLGSACVTQRVPSDTESGTVDFAKTEECRNAAPQLNPIRSTSSVPDERCQNELKGSVINRILEGYSFSKGTD